MLLFPTKKNKDKTIKKEVSAYVLTIVKKYIVNGLKHINADVTVAPNFPQFFSAIFTINMTVVAPKNKEVNRPTYKLRPKRSWGMP